MIDRATIERILEAANIVDVVSDFVTLKRRGAAYVACCPFHTEKTPSFHVTPRLGIYKCFGCGKGGNAINFVMEHEQMSYIEAVKYLGQKYGIEVKEKEETAEEIASRQKREALVIVNDFAQKYFTDALLNTPEGQAVGLSYFQERKFSRQTIDTFLLGYAPKERASFSKEAVAKGYKREFLVELGLSVPKRYEEAADNQELTDRFYERVIFPIRGITGQVVGFGARKLRGDKNIPKYINSPENVLYVKNKTLYGLYEAKAAITKKQNCYLVEGYTDVISLHQSGIINVVASCGTSLTVGQIQLIKRFSPKVTIIYDGDAAGVHASLRGIDMFLQEGLDVKVALFPNDEDPDSYARSHTSEELLKFLEEAEEDFIYYQLRTLSQNAENDPFKQGEIIGEIAQSISLIPSAITRDVYINETAKKMNISASAIAEKVGQLRDKKDKDEYFQRVRKEKEQKKEEVEHPEQPKTKEVIELYEAERTLIYYLLKFGAAILREESNYMVNGAPKAEASVSQYIKAQMEADDLKFQDAVLAKIYDEYFTLPLESDIQKHFACSPDLEVSKVVIDIFQSRYKFRSEKLEKSLIDEKDILPSLVPKAVCIYKAKVVALRIAELAPQIEKAHLEQDTATEMNLYKTLQALSKVKLELLRRSIWKNSLKDI